MQKEFNVYFVTINGIKYLHKPEGWVVYQIENWEEFSKTDNQLVAKIGDQPVIEIADCVFRKKNFRWIEKEEFLRGKLDLQKMMPHLKKIGARAFSNTFSLSSVVFPTSIEEIDEYAFEKCFDLQGVILRDAKNIKAIKEGAFCECPALNTIQLPNNISEIGNYAFANCPELSWVKFEGTKQEWLAINEGEIIFANCSTKLMYEKVKCIDDKVDIFNGSSVKKIKTEN